MVATAKIAKAKLTVSTVAKTKTFGEDDPTPEIAYNGFKGKDWYEDDATLDKETAAGFSAPTIGRTAGENVGGDYTYSLTENGAANNYEFVYDTQNYKKLTINPKDLNDATPGVFNFTPAGGDLTYNGYAQTKNFTITYSGAFDDALKPMASPADYAFVYKNNTNAGDKAEIIITGQGNFTGSRIEYFTINKKNIYIKPNNAEKTYGADDPHYLLDDTDEDWEAASPADYKLGTLVASETPGVYNFVEDEAAETEGLKGTVTLAREPGENVSSYKIYVKSYTEGEGDNYAVDNVVNDVASDSYKNLTSIFQINPAGDGLVLRFKEGTVASKTYGDDDPVYQFSDLEYVSGLVGDDEGKWDVIKEELITPAFKISVKYKDVAHNGENKLVVEGLASTNYPNVTVQDLPFTVNPRKVAVLVKPQAIVYGAGLDQTQDADHWRIIEETADAWKGNTTDVLYTDLTVTLSTKEDLPTYGPGVHDKVIVATSDNDNYVIDTNEDNSIWGKLTVTPVDLVFEVDDDVLTKIVANDGQTVNVKIDFSNRVDRKFNPTDTEGITWTAEKWNTLVLPFDITVSDLSKALGYAIVNVINPSATKIEGSNIEFYGKLTMTGGNGYVDETDAKKNDTKLAANKPIMVKTAEPVTGLVDFGTQTIVAPTDMSVDAGQGAKFVGTYVEKTVTKDNNEKIWFMTGDYTAWDYIGKTSDASWDIVPFEAYIDMNTLSGVRSMTFVLEDVNGSTTAIKSVNADNFSTKLNGWYTLDGVKLQAAPTQKGVYIKDGKKVVLK